MDGKIKATRGLTLIEVMIAMVVLVIAILGLTSTFVSGLKISQSSVNLTGATNVARELLETVKKRGYAATTVGEFDGRVPEPSHAGSGFPPAPYPQTLVDGQQYVLLVRCREASPTLRSVEVDVYWAQDSKATFGILLHQ